MKQLSNLSEVSPLRVSRVLLQTRQPGPDLQAAPIMSVKSESMPVLAGWWHDTKKGAQLFRKHLFCCFVCIISVLTTNVPSSLPRPWEN